MASKYLQKYPIPGAFPELLHDFAREVLRDQPENIYEYGALYFAAIEEVSGFFHYIWSKLIFVTVREFLLTTRSWARASLRRRTESPPRVTIKKCHRV